MKHVIALLSVFILSGLTATATTTNTLDDTINTTTSYRGYGNSFIFVENGIEFSIFPDGQFDFFMNNYGPNVNVSIGTPNVNISFNSGYDYNPYLQYDEFGAIIQIEHTPIFYDYFGRVSQVGDIFINYNQRGFINRVGGLNIFYNRYNSFSHCSGFINFYNRHYVYRPWHAYYVIPSFNHCVVYNRPYRQYYTPTRYNYTRPYSNSYRRTTAVASRRGSKVVRHRELATRSHGNTRRNDQLAANTSRTSSNTDITNRSNTRSRGNSPRPYLSESSNNRTKPNVRTKPNSRSLGNSPRPNLSTKPKVRSKPKANTRVRSNNIKRNSSQNVTKPIRTVSNKTRRNNSRATQKPNSSSLRKYSKARNTKHTSRSVSKSDRRRK